jgi:uncharacterized protein
MRTLAFLAAIGCLTFAAAAHAAGFDCAKASSAIEKAICADPDLSKADDRLTDAFAATLAATLQPEELRRAQAIWLQQRDGIAGKARLSDAYRSRISELTALKAKWLAVRRAVDPESARQKCVVPPDAPDDARCSVEKFGAVPGSNGLVYQLQKYQQDDLRLAGGAVVLRKSSDALVPVVAVAEESAYYEEPSVVRSPAGELLLVPGAIDGTGHINASVLFRLEADRLTEIDTRSWLYDLQNRLPQGWGAWKGIFPDYRTFTARSALWKGGDANCCPTAGRADIKLKLTGDRLVIENVAIARGAKAVESLD